MAYADYLRSPHWSMLRLHAFRLAGNSCEACRGNRFLEGHHLRYKPILEDCTPEDIMCLCQDCHGFWHAWLEEKRKRLENYNRESTIDKLRNLFIRRIYSCNTPNVVELHGLPLDIAEALDRKLSLAPPASPDSKKNWAVKKLIFELKQSGKLTKLIRRKLLV